MKDKLFKMISNQIIFSICIAGIFIALILVLNLVFDLFKVGSWSIQFFLIVYALGIYKIRNIVVNIFFLLVVPPLLFAVETGPYVINASQVFFEYFLSFYIYALMYIFSFINLQLKKLHFKKPLFVDYVIFLISYCLLLVLKFFMHSIASYVWWGTEKFWPALVFNGPWLLVNCITIPVAIVVAFPLINLFEKFNFEQKNKW